MYTFPGLGLIFVIDEILEISERNQHMYSLARAFAFGLLKVWKQKKAQTKY